MLDQLRQDGAWSQDALLWTPNEIPPENFFGLKQAQDDTVYGERYHQDLDFLISSPLVQKLFPQEVETIFERRLSESRALVAEDPVKWQKALATLYANGDVQDFNQLLLYSLDQPQLPLYSLYQDNPHFFKEKAVASSDQFPSLLNLVDYFDLSQTDPYFHPNCQELINLLAKDLKAAVIDQKFGPIEKQKIFQILTQKDNRQFELENLLEPDDQINPALAKELLVYLRTLPGIEDNMSPTESVEETGLQFAAGINRLNQEIRTGQLATFETALKSLDIVSYLARHPEQIELIFRLPEEVPEFMELVSEGGSLEDNRDQLINYLFADGQLLDRAREMVKIFAGNTPLADRTMAFIEARLKLELQSVVSGYPVGNEEEITGFDQLSYENKMRELFHRISQAINISRSTQAKERASQRNQTLAQARSNFQFQSGMYLHGMSATTLPLFFRNGNLAGEALGPSAQADSYPFHVDYSYLDDELSSRDLNLDQTIAQLPTESFGRGRENDHDLQVILVTDRRISQWEKDITYFAGNTGQSKHTLILGATPTTETHYVLLRDPQGSLPMFIQASVQAEHYIPAYAISQTDQFQAGELIFSYEDFRQKLAQAKPYQNFQEFIEKNQNLESDLLKPYQEVSQHGAHRFNLAEHLQLASEKAQLIAQKNKLNDHETLLVQLAALLHDVGKQASGVQEVDNPVIAQGYLNKIQKLSPDEEELILNLIRYDELLGDIVQGKKSPSQFERLFPNQRHRLMLLTLYQADVQSIDNDLSENGLYQIWQVETKLRELGIIS